MNENQEYPSLAILRGRGVLVDPRSFTDVSESGCLILEGDNRTIQDYANHCRRLIFRKLEEFVERITVEREKTIGLTQLRTGMQCLPELYFPHLNTGDSLFFRKVEISNLDDYTIVDRTFRLGADKDLANEYRCFDVHMAIRCNSPLELGDIELLHNDIDPDPDEPTRISMAFYQLYSS